MQLKKILVPVDGSEHSTRAAEYAAELIKLTGGAVILMHSHRSLPAYLGEPYFQEALDKINSASRQLLDPYLKLFKNAGIPVTDTIMEGAPGEMICRVAEVEKCDLIVMGSRGHGDLAGLILGSVAHRVLQSSVCPVLVVR